MPLNTDQLLLKRINYTPEMLARLRSIGLVVLTLLVAGEQNLFAQLQERALEIGGAGQKRSKLFRPVDVSGAGIDFVRILAPVNEPGDVDASGDGDAGAPGEPMAVLMLGNE